MPTARRIPRTLDEIGAHRSAHLTRYQNSAYAPRYPRLVERVAQAERAARPDSNELAIAVAKGYAKLLAYKDEYEVARLYADGAFRNKIEGMFEGDYKLVFHLAPPLLAKPDPRTGEPRKLQFGGWMLPVFGLLAKLKGLRGTALDLFGRTEERRMERALIAEYEQTVATLLDGLTRDNHALAVDIASLPEAIRGYGPIKSKSVDAARKKREELLARYRPPPSAPPHGNRGQGQ